MVRIWLCEYNPNDPERVRQFISGMHEAKLNPYYAEHKPTIDHIDAAIARAEKQLAWINREKEVTEEINARKPRQPDSVLQGVIETPSPFSSDEELQKVKNNLAATLVDSTISESWREWSQYTIDYIDWLFWRREYYLSERRRYR